MRHKLKEVLSNIKITQKELAGKIGMSEVGVSKLINGTTTKATLEKIANVLGVDISDVIIEEKVYKAKFGSDKTPLHLNALELPCYVLEDGTRVFSGRGIQKSIGATSVSGSWLSRFVCTEPIKGFLTEIKSGDSNAFEKITSPIRFIRNNAGGSQSETYGYEATLLIDLCDAIIKAGELGFDIPDEYVRNANVIVRATAKTGIIALVDEATGYDKEKTRAKDELQKFFATFLIAEAAKWIKSFDDVFFEDLYKMRGWTWTKTTKRPGVVGTWIKEIVYDRLGPILYELEKLNPKNDNGHRSYKHHQFLSRDVGLPRLKQHLEAIHAIAVISNYEWNRFIVNLDRAYPRKYQELYLFDE